MLQCIEWLVVLAAFGACILFVINSANIGVGVFLHSLIWLAILFFRWRSRRQLIWPSIIQIDGLNRFFVGFEATELAAAKLEGCYVGPYLLVLRLQVLDKKLAPIIWLSDNLDADTRRQLRVRLRNMNQTAIKQDFGA